MKNDSNTKENLVIYISIALMFISAYLFISKQIRMNSNETNFSIKSIDTKNISIVKISYKNSIKNMKSNSKIQDIVLVNDSLNNKTSKNNVITDDVSRRLIARSMPVKLEIDGSEDNYFFVAMNSDISGAKIYQKSIYQNGALTQQLISISSDYTVTKL